VSPFSRRYSAGKKVVLMLTQNVTLLTSAIEVSSSNHREKTEHSEVLVFLSFPQENPGKYLEMGYKNSVHIFSKLIFTLFQIVCVA